jgi:hypothetical protein
MRVTRITIDHELGLIELKTGPGGDGDYVLLPIQLEDAMKRYVEFAGEPAVEAPVTEVRNAAGEIAIVAPGGWGVPKDQAYDFNTTDGLGAYDAAMSDPIQVERGGYKYPSGPRVGVEYVRSPEFQKDFDAMLAANHDRPATHFPIKPKEECDGNCGAHEKKGKADDVWTTAPGEDAPERDRHTGPATITNPIRVFAEEHSRGYKLTTPSIPGWRETVNQYDLYKVPGMVRDTLEDMGTELASNYPVSIMIIEEEQ